MADDDIIARAAELLGYASDQDCITLVFHALREMANRADTFPASLAERLQADPESIRRWQVVAAIVQLETLEQIARP